MRPEDVTEHTYGREFHNEQHYCGKYCTQTAKSARNGLRSVEFGCASRNFGDGAAVTPPQSGFSITSAILLRVSLTAPLIVPPRASNALLARSYSGMRMAPSDGQPGGELSRIARTLILIALTFLPGHYECLTSAGEIQISPPLPASSRILGTHAACRNCKSWQCFLLQIALIRLLANPMARSLFPTRSSPFCLMNGSRFEQVGEVLARTRSAALRCISVIIDSIWGPLQGLVFRQFGRFC